MTHPNAVLLFAAGFGTRMAPLTDTRPKPLIQVQSRSLLDHALDIVDRFGVARTVVNTHYRAAQIASHLEGRDIAISHETPDILDTGGGLRHALPLLGAGPVFTMNTDAIWAGPNAFALLSEAWDPDRMDALLLCVPHVQTLGHLGSGDFTIAADGRLTRQGPWVYSGAQIIKTEALHSIAETSFSLNVLWNQMHANGRLFGVNYPGRWCDVGHPESIALAEDLLAHV